MAAKRLPARPAAKIDSAVWVRGKIDQIKQRYHQSPNKKLYLFLLVFLVVLYAPYLLRGGLTYDDWSVDALSKACPGFFRSVGCFWSGYPDRPLAAPYYALISNIFRDWAPGYFFLSITMWLGGVWLVFKVLKKKFGLNFAVPFFLVASMPSVASTIVFSPAMQGIGATTFFVWALSFYFLDKYVATRQLKYQMVSAFLLLCSLFLYESSMPLFAFNVVWPYIISSKKLTREYVIQYIKQYIVPVFIVLVIVFVYQKFIVLHFFGYISKLRVLDIPDKANFGIRVLVNDFYDLTIGAANLSAWGMIRVWGFGLFALACLVVMVIAAWRLLRMAKVEVFKKRIFTERTYLSLYLIMLVAAAGIAALHFAAVLPPTIVGYNDRGFVAGVIIIALFSAMMWQKYGTRSRILAVVWILCFASYSASFIIQRSNYSEASKQRNHILAGAVSSLARTPHKPKIFVLADTPVYTAKNFNNETIFSNEVFDWGISLSVRTKDVYLQGISISPERLARGELYVDGNDLIVKSSQKIPLSKVWFYNTYSGQLLRIDTPEKAEAVLDYVKVHHRDYPVSVDTRTRDQFTHWLINY